MYRHHFADQLPGVEVDHSQGVGLRLYQRVADRDRDTAIRDRRLASPDHYRLYFALATPSHTLSQSDYDAAWGAASQGTLQLSKVLLKLHGEELSRSLSKADILLERLERFDTETLTPDRARSFLLSFADVMDDAYSIRPFDTFWVLSLWERAMSAMPRLLKALGLERVATVEEMFRLGRAIGWLTKVFRQETFSHGLFGDHPKSIGDWILTDDEFDSVVVIMLARYQSLTVPELLAIPNPLSILFAWLQAGDVDGPRKLIQAYIGPANQFVDVLHGLTTQISSSDRGEYSVLKRENLSHFVDYDAARQRIELMQEGAKGQPKKRVHTLAKAFADADHL